MNDYLFDIGDQVEYDSTRGEVIRGPIVGRQTYSDGNYYFVGLSNPWLTEILVREDKLRNAK